MEALIEIDERCPHCDAPISLLIDASAAEVQDYIEDCEVCCAPIRVCIQVTDPSRSAIQVRLDRET